jgi:hypothetical protein
MGYVGGQSFAFTAGSRGTLGTTQITGTSCGQATSFQAPILDVTIGAGGGIVDVYPSGQTTTTTNMGIGITSPCTFTPASGSGTITTLPYGFYEGQGGYETATNDNNMMGVTLYDNSGEPGSPLNSIFAIPSLGTNVYGEPGVSVNSFGQYLGVKVGG